MGRAHSSIQKKSSVTGLPEHGGPGIHSTPQAGERGRGLAWRGLRVWVQTPGSADAEADQAQLDPTHISDPSPWWLCRARREGGSNWTLLEVTGISKECVDESRDLNLGTLRQVTRTPEEKMTVGKKQEAGSWQVESEKPLAHSAGLSRRLPGESSGWDSRKFADLGFHHTAQV